MNKERNDSSPDTPYPDVADVNPYQTSLLAENERTWAEGDQGKKSISEVARWQTFFSVLLCIGLFLLVLVFLTQILFGGSVGAINGMLCGGSIGSIFYGIPALLLWRASVASKKFVASESMSQFEEFARAQAVLWRVIGILAIILMIGYGVMMITLVGGIQY